MHPIIGHLAGTTIYSYGVFQLLGYGVGLVLLRATAKRLDEPLTVAAQALGAVLMGGFIGARLGFVLVNLREPYPLIQILSSGGSVFQTGVLGALAGLVAVGLIQKRSIGTGFDLVTPTFIGAWAVGNVGCFLAGCCAGGPTSLPWAIQFNAESTPLELRGIAVHPAQLYSLAFELLLLAGLLAWRRSAPGELFLRAVVGMAALRVGLAVGGVTLGRVAASTMVYGVLGVVAAVVLGVVRRRANRQPSSESAEA